VISIIAIDPGLRCTGVAYYTPLGDWEASSIRPKGRSLIERIDQILERIGSDYWDLAVIEKPQVYQGRLQKGDPNDLIDLAVLVGALVCHINATKFLLPRPQEWKGQVPKEIHHRRIRKAVPGLGRQSKDALDAVGLGLYGMEWFNARSKKK
jgi:hypothetical protein